jgi:hypothetical protein
VIRVRVELCSANDGSVREIARMEIANDGGKRADDVANYIVRTLRGRDTKALERHEVNRSGRVMGHRKNALHVWHLVAKALNKMGYGYGADIHAPR